MNMKMDDVHEAAADREDLHGLVESVGDQDLDGQEEEEDDDTEVDLWLDRDLLEVHDHDSSSFYIDFPPLPSISSSSSSSSSSLHPTPLNDAACRCSSSYSKSSSSSLSSSSSSSSPASETETMFKSEQKSDYQMADATVQPKSLLSTPDSMQIPPPFDPQMDVDCINVIDEELGDMDLIDLWEQPNSMFPFPCENPQEQEQEHQQQIQQKKKEEEEGPQDERPSEDLGMLFLEWLKSNKESISAEDLRSIKLKKSTIECAAQRLGGGKEGMTQLLKLILQWVQNHQLHKRRMQSSGGGGGGGGGVKVSSSPNPYHPPQQHCFQNPNPISSSNSHLHLSSSTPWIPHQPFYADPTVANVGFSPTLGYMGDPAFTNGAGLFCNRDYPTVDNAATWHTPLPQHFIPAPPPLQVFGSGSVGNQYYSGPTQGKGERLVNMGSSATKEARKKRMARQRRFLSHHRNHNHLHHQHHHSSTTKQHARLATDANCTTSTNDEISRGNNWVFWPSTATPPAATTTPVMPSDVAPPSDHQRQVVL